MPAKAIITSRLQLDRVRYRMVPQKGMGKAVVDAAALTLENRQAISDRFPALASPIDLFYGSESAAISRCTTTD